MEPFGKWDFLLDLLPMFRGTMESNLAATGVR